MSALEDDQQLDDTSIGLQMQQFLDEWHYRVLHASLATEWDRHETLVKAMDLFELHGLYFESQQEKEELAQKDEDDMVACLVQKMNLPLRKTFEHFTLQLQLVVSKATRVRRALEDNGGDELARVMEDGDTGISQQVLKTAIVEAGREISELRELHGSWEQAMNSRVGRLTRCADDCEHAARELEALSAQFGGFGGSQKQKSAKVLSKMAAGHEKTLLKTILSAWIGNYIRYKAEEDIHQKFRSQIAEAEAKLMEYKQAHLSNVRNVLSRKAAGSDDKIMQEVLAAWFKATENEKEEKELGGRMKAAQDKLASYKSHQQENTKKVMMRMTAGNDNTLSSLCFQAWNAVLVEANQDKEMKEAVKAAEGKLNEFMKKKSEEAKGVLSRMTGSTDTGLLHSVFNAWAEDFREEKQGAEMEAAIQKSTQKFSSLNQRQKGAASGTAGRANEMLEENILGQIFINWATEARIEAVIKVFSGKLDAKKHQLEAVQSMFKNFADRLEQGIGNSPRSQRKSNRSHGREASDAGSRPPLPA